MKIKQKLALLVISALLIGLLPLGNAAVSKAEQDSTSAEQVSTSAEPASSETAEGIAWAYYGLNNPTTDSDGVVTWDCVWFGNYWQEDTHGDGKANKNDAKQPIKWRVLSVDGDDAFLLADKSLDCQSYNETYAEDVIWETCTMRSWLNGYGAEANRDGKDYSRGNFLDYAFTSAEQSAIRTTYVVNDDNPVYGRDGGNDTFDKVYLLSIDEVMNPSYGFTSIVASTETRRAVNTAYVAAGGEAKSSMYSAGSADWWWLRSPGYSCDDASYVKYNGYVFRDAGYVCDDAKAVRPALHLNLSSVSSWSYAGTVISEGGEIGSAKVALLKLKQKKRTVTVSWNKVTGAAGYQIWYSTSKKWKGKKRKLLRENKVTVRNLKKKTYYFRVRAYWLGSVRRAYGEWSKTKKITMKK